MHHPTLPGVALLLMSCACMIPLASSPGAAPDALRDAEEMITPIHRVQGAGPRSPLEGQRVTVRGVVTGRTDIGVFLQSLDGQADDDPATSEGLFVYLGKPAPPNIRVGTQLRVEGIVSEGSAAAANDATRTQIKRARLHVELSHLPLPPPILLHQDDVARTPHLTHLDSMRVHLAALNNGTYDQGAPGTRWLVGMADQPAHRPATRGHPPRTPGRRIGVNLDHVSQLVPWGTRCVASNITGTVTLHAGPVPLIRPLLDPLLECRHTTAIPAPR